MTEYFSERDRDKAEKTELKKAKDKLKAHQQPILKPMKVKSLSQSPQYQTVEERPMVAKRQKKRKRRPSRPVSTKVAKSIRKAERQATGVFRDTPSNVIGLRHTPRRSKGRGKSARRMVSDTLADEQNGRKIIDEFLS